MTFDFFALFAPFFEFLAGIFTAIFGLFGT